jgi:hypothetical protein
LDLDVRITDHNLDPGDNVIKLFTNNFLRG